MERFISMDVNQTQNLVLERKKDFELGEGGGGSLIMIMTEMGMKGSDNELLLALCLTIVSAFGIQC